MNYIERLVGRALGAPEATVERLVAPRFAPPVADPIGPPTPGSIESTRPEGVAAPEFAPAPPIKPQRALDDAPSLARFPAPRSIESVLAPLRVTLGKSTPSLRHAIPFESAEASTLGLGRPSSSGPAVGASTPLALVRDTATGRVAPSPHDPSNRAERSPGATRVTTGTTNTTTPLGADPSPSAGAPPPSRQAPRGSGDVVHDPPAAAQEPRAPAANVRAPLGSPLLPAAPPARAEQVLEPRALDADAPKAPTIRISIGRIDVRAVAPAEAPRSPARPAGPRLGLDDYLRGRR